jgi:hypothetical protein
MFGFVAVVVVVIAFILTNPSRERRLATMREYATWEAPYEITEAELRAANFQYQSFGVCSVMRLRDEVYTYGFLGIVSTTERLRPLLIKIRTHQKID